MNTADTHPPAASAPKRTTTLDYELGARIAAFRVAKGLSQTALGEAIGVTFQQVQKYEKGQNRISAARLPRVAEILGVTVSALMGLPEGASGEATETLAFLSVPGAAALLRDFSGIKDAQARRDVLSLVAMVKRNAPAAQAAR